MPALRSLVYYLLLAANCRPAAAAAVHAAVVAHRVASRAQRRSPAQGPCETCRWSFEKSPTNPELVLLLRLPLVLSVPPPPPLPPPVPRSFFAVALWTQPSPPRASSRRRPLDDHLEHVESFTAMLSGDSGLVFGHERRRPPRPWPRRRRPTPRAPPIWSPWPRPPAAPFPPWIPCRRGRCPP